MNSPNTGAAGARHATAAPPMPHTQQTLLFPSLLKRIDPDRRLAVLEIGRALPNTMAFFSQYKCRMHFAAMYTDPVLQMQSGDISEAELVDHFSQSLSLVGDARFDLCLFWDFLNYLDDKALRAFSQVIQRHVHNTTRAHAFTVRTLDTSFPYQQYGIDQAHMFSIKPHTGQRARTYPHTQTTLLNLMPCFDIDQGMLLPDGRLEVLMTASLQNNDSDLTG